MCTRVILIDIVLVIKLDPGPASSYTKELPMPEDEQEWRPDIGRDVELGVLDEVENMEDRICHASLQVKVRALCAIWGHQYVNVIKPRPPGH
jgi:hypothetical protein